MAKKNTIHLVITGGTIDSYYDTIQDKVIPNKESVLPNYIKSLKLYFKVEVSTICMKDSRDLNRTDLNKILKTIEDSPYNKILITHGTYTMSDTAKYLKANLKRKDQVIVFTASMIPLSGFTPSDAPFNLGYSFAELNKLDNGIYVCMNGKTFVADEVFKFISEGRFMSIYTK